MNSHHFGYHDGPPVVNADLMREVEAGFDPAELTPRYAPTPPGRLAQLALEALDHDDYDMVRVCLLRLLNLGGKR